MYELMKILKFADGLQKVIEGIAQVEMRVILEVSPPGKLLPNLQV